jgi:hypothetical protein
LLLYLSEFDVNVGTIVAKGGKTVSNVLIMLRSMEKQLLERICLSDYTEVHCRVIRIFNHDAYPEVATTMD